MRLLFLFALLLFTPAQARQFYVPVGGSQININGTDQNGAGNNVFINYLKAARGWTLSGTQVAPSALDQNGNALASLASSAPFQIWFQPQAAERPGNYVQTSAGFGELRLSTLNPGPQNIVTVSCTGVTTAGGDCSNSTCTGMQGYIALNVLHVTTAPSGGASCALVIGQPVSASSAITGTYTSSTGAVTATLSHDIGVGVGAKVIVASIGNGALGAVQQLNGTVTTTSGTGGTTLNYTAPTGLCGSSATALSCTGGVFSFTTGDAEPNTINTFGTPAIIIGESGSSNCPSCTGTGGIGTYLLNYSLTVGNSGDLVALTPGIRQVWHPNGNDSSTNQDEIKFQLLASTTGDRVRWPAAYHINDEQDYDDQNLTALGTLTQANYRTFMSHPNFSVARDLGVTFNVAFNTVSTWATTRPPQYAAYNGYEQRPNMYAGTASYSFIGVTNCAAGINCYTLDWFANAGVAPTDRETLIFKIPSGGGLQGQTSLQAVTYTSGSTFTNGVYPNVPVTTVSGSGSGAIAALVIVQSSQVVQVVFRGGISGGTGYAVGDSLSLTVGGHTLSMTVSTINNGGLGYAAEISVDNGNTYYPLMTNGGQVIYSTAFLPANTLIQITFDVDLGGWLLGQTSAGGGGLFNPVSPPIFTQICAELGVQPWFVEPTWAADSQSDFAASTASYVKANYPSMHPWFEPPDEQWNAGQQQYVFSESKGEVWMGLDPVNWAEPAGFIFPGLNHDEYGKIVSTLGQAVASVYGSSGYEIIAGVQTPNGTSYTNTLTYANRLKANAYVNQTFAAQSGFIKAPAYNYATWVAVTDYWNPLMSVGAVKGYGPIGETPIAYQWFYGNSSVRAAQMSAYVDTAAVYLQEFQTYYASWNQFATTCAGASPPSCKVKGIVGYEGGNSVGNHGVTGSTQPGDTTQAISGAVNATQCVLNLGPLPINNGGGTTFPASIVGTTLVATTNSPQPSFSPGMIATGAGVAPNTTITAWLNDPNQENMQVTPSQTVSSTTMQVFGSGAVVGMSNLELTNVVNGSGGTWASSYTGLIVAATTPTTITISNLDCSGLGTLTSAKLTYVGSGNQVTMLREESYEAAESGQIDRNNYQNFVSAGGTNPSQSNEVAGGGFPWFLENFDIYGWFPFGNCTACNISGSTVTLGGAVTGEFLVGQPLLGSGVATLQNSAANTTITGCTLGGGNVAPCGTTAGDQLTLSQPAFATETGVNIASFNLSTLASYSAIRGWNGGH